MRRTLSLLLASAIAVTILAPGCKSTRDWREQADKRAATYLDAAQKDVTGRSEAIEVETPADTLRRRLLLDQGLLVNDAASFGIRDLPTNRYWRAEERLLPGGAGGAADLAPGGTNALEIGFLDAVRIAAHNSRDFRAAKESLFTAALALDLENKAFRTTFNGLVSGNADTVRADGEDRTGSHGETAKLGLARKFETGAELSGAIAFNLAGMLTGDRATAWGSVADASFTIPLLRGAGSLVNRESLTQAERNLLYAVRSFEQTKRNFVVEIEGEYLSLLLAKRTRQNEDDNYRRVILSTRRSRRMADANRMSKAAFDQSHQSELSARANWIAACQTYESRLESFKTRLGLPPDARIEPREADLEKLQTYAERFAIADDESKEVDVAPESIDEGAMKLRADRAIRTAFSNRLDFVTYRDKVEDAQRHLLVAEDALRAELTIGGSARVGEAASSSMGGEGKSHTDFQMKNASGNGTIKLDLPFDRTAERNSYRNALIALEQAVRTYQEQEDALKKTIRQDLRDLSQTEENLRIQFLAVDLARRRVRNQDLLLESGRAEMTDVLDAQAALVSAQNALYSAITSYRRNELRLQADLGLLEVSVDGTWKEN